MSATRLCSCPAHVHNNNIKLPRSISVADFSARGSKCRRILHRVTALSSIGWMATRAVVAAASSSAEDCQEDDGSFNSSLGSLCNQTSDICQGLNCTTSTTARVSTTIAGESSSDDDTIIAVSAAVGGFLLLFLVLTVILAICYRRGKQRSLHFIRSMNMNNADLVISNPAFRENNTAMLGRMKFPPFDQKKGMNWDPQPSGIGQVTVSSTPDSEVECGPARIEQSLGQEPSTILLGTQKSAIVAGIGGFKIASLPLNISANWNASDEEKRQARVSIAIVDLSGDNEFGEDISEARRPHSHSMVAAKARGSVGKNRWIETSEENRGRRQLPRLDSGADGSDVTAESPDESHESEDDLDAAQDNAAEAESCESSLIQRKVKPVVPSLLSLTSDDSGITPPHSATLFLSSPGSPPPRPTTPKPTRRLKPAKRTDLSPEADTHYKQTF